MKVHTSKHFQKDFKACPVEIQRKAKAVYESLADCKKLADIPHLEKLVEKNRNYFRVRISSYRLGFELKEGGEIELLALMHRKEIYRFFP